MAHLNVKTFCIVTGASRGIGKETAIQLATKVHPKSSFHLIARNKEALKDTENKIRSAVGQDIEIRCVVADLSTEEGVEKSNQDIFENLGDISRFSHAILVHNIASVGDMTKYARDLDDMKYLQDFNRLNLSGPIVLTSRFFKAFGHGKDSLRKTVVQITSESGTHPYKTMHTYCMVKAGRDMFFRVMALEEPEARFMTYNPGAVDTNGYSDTFTSVDEEVQEYFKNITKKSFFLSPKQSVGALVKSLEEDKFESGAVVYAYEVLGMKVEF